MRGPGRKRGTWRCKHGAPPTPSSPERGPFRGRAGLPRRARSLRGALPGSAARVSGGGVGAVQGPGGPRPEAALAGREPRWSGAGGECALLAASPSSRPPPEPQAPRRPIPREEVMWRNALGGPARSRGPGAGGGGGPGPSPPAPTPERGAPGRAPARGGVRAGRGRGKRQLRFQRLGPRASSRCRRTGRCEAWKPLLEGRNRSDSVHSGRVGPGTLGWTWRLDWIRPGRVRSH